MLRLVLDHFRTPGLDDKHKLRTILPRSRPFSEMTPSSQLSWRRTESSARPDRSAAEDLATARTLTPPPELRTRCVSPACAL